MKQTWQHKSKKNTYIVSVTDDYVSNFVSRLLYSVAQRMRESGAAAKFFCVYFFFFFFVSCNPTVLLCLLC